jgi:hypothetical protein
VRAGTTTTAATHFPRRSIPVFKAPSTPNNITALPIKTGKHVGVLTDTAAYYEYWAARYPGAQLAKERDRLNQGKAKHRAEQDIPAGGTRRPLPMAA